jgi:ketosteroid isomerase-like protein
MSDENVESLRRLYADWERGDFGAGWDLFASDVFFDPGSPGDKPVLGLERVVAHFRDFLSQCESFRVVPQDFSAAGRTDAGDEVVLVTERQYGTGSVSRVPIDQTFYAAWTFRAGIVVAVSWKTQRKTALEAAGLQV